MAQDTSPPPSKGRQFGVLSDPKILIRFLIFLLLMAVVLFGLAGRWDWWMGWAYLLLFLALIIVSAIVVPTDPELIEERTTMKEDVKSWDKVLAGIPSVLMPFGWLIVAGLDLRYGWSREIPLWIQALAFLLGAAGYGLSIWAAASNKFYGRFVRIQKERGHTTISDGPYRFIRHPGYAGICLFCLTSPLALGSLWALTVGGFLALLLLIRTALEDKTLLAELPGYVEYSHRTRYRLLPGVW
jgi:protein-S-isoprenylcysteine O-methyltransferase Ste14